MKGIIVYTYEKSLTSRSYTLPFNARQLSQTKYRMQTAAVASLTLLHEIELLTDLNCPLLSDWAKWIDKV